LPNRKLVINKIIGVKKYSIYFCNFITYFKVFYPLLFF
jgi:hypothetical protein